MKEEYIKQVEKELPLSRKVKQAIIRDLNEIFSSAVENGETEQDVIERLGSPKEFADNTAEQLGIDVDRLQKRKMIFPVIVLFTVAVVAFAFYGMMQVQKMPENVIGYADTMTGIKVEGTLGMNISVIILGLGILAVIIGIIRIIRIINKKQSD
ncbi:MAG: hypothetical protein Q4B26_15495 [Eubacteriales bacterium]|nr:hypothetical protein [Eubacteriales bacterium]